MKRRQFGCDLRGVEAAAGGGFMQRDVAAAAEVQAVLMEHAGGAGDGAGQIAKGLIGQLNGHDRISGWWKVICTVASAVPGRNRRILGVWQFVLVKSTIRR